MGCARPNTPRSNPYDLGELVKPLRDRLWTLFLDAPGRGSGLTLVSGYRDPGRQWDLRHERCRGRECDRACKGVPVTALPAIWDGSKWVGGSKHQHRLAADIGGRDLSWAIANHRRYGLVRTVASENWHYEPLAAPTVRIVAYPGKTYDGAPVTGPTAPVAAAGARTLKVGMSGDDVRRYQRSLNVVTTIWHLGNHQPIDEDGKFGRRTAARSNEFEREHNQRSRDLAKLTGTVAPPSLQVDFAATPPTQWYAAVWAGTAKAA